MLMFLHVILEVSKDCLNGLNEADWYFQNSADEDSEILGWLS